MTASTFDFGTPSSLARSVAKPSIALSRWAFRSSRMPFSAVLSLAWLTPRSLASARELLVARRRGGRSRACRGRPAEGRGRAAGSAARRAASPRSRRAWWRGRSGRAGRAGLVLVVERRADLRLGDAELGRELLGERGAHVAAMAVALDLARRRPALVERGLDLGLGDAELLWRAPRRTRRGGRRPCPCGRRAGSPARRGACPARRRASSRRRRGPGAGRRGSRASRDRARNRSRSRPAGRRWRSGPRAPGRRLSGSRARRPRRRARGRPRGQPPSSWCVGSWQEHRHGH